MRHSQHKNHRPGTHARRRHRWRYRCAHYHHWPVKSKLMWKWVNAGKCDERYICTRYALETMWAPAFAFSILPPGELA